MESPQESLRGTGGGGLLNPYMKSPNKIPAIALELSFFFQVDDFWVRLDTKCLPDTKINTSMVPALFPDSPMQPSPHPSIPSKILYPIYPSRILYQPPANMRFIKFNSFRDLIPANYLCHYLQGYPCKEDLK